MLHKDPYVHVTGANFATQATRTAANVENDRSIVNLRGFKLIISMETSHGCVILIWRSSKYSTVVFDDGVRLKACGPSPSLRLFIRLQCGSSSGINFQS